MSTEFFQKKHRKATKIGSWKKPKSFRGRKKTKIKEKKMVVNKLKIFQKKKKIKGISMIVSTVKIFLKKKNKVITFFPRLFFLVYGLVLKIKKVSFY